MIKKRISTVMILLTMMTSICVVVYAAEPRWKGSLEFLVDTHLVYTASYSEQFKPVDSGAAKIVNDCHQVVSYGVLVTGVRFCNTDGTVGSCPFNASLTIDSPNDTADWTYMPNLSASASYKAFLEPTNGLHLRMNRVTVWHQ